MLVVINVLIQYYGKMFRNNDKESVDWAKQIKYRDNYVCQVCRHFEYRLNSHHINSWDIFIGLRYDLNNGITLCEKCHILFHSIYGKGKNTTHQFKEFINIYRTLFEQLLKSS